jgi:DNA-binding CsgD family transcriptional regulator
MALGSGGRLLYANEVARSCLGPEGPLRLRQGRLVGSGAAARYVFEALARLEQTGRPQFFALQGTGRPAGGTGAAAQAFAVTACIEQPGRLRQQVLILEPFGERGPLDETALRHWLGLTDAQARVAAALSRGLSPEDAARHCGRSIATIRTHIRGILERTNLQSLQQLYRALAGLGRGWFAQSR